MAINLPHNISELLSLKDSEAILDFMFRPPTSNTLYNPGARQADSGSQASTRSASGNSPGKAEASTWDPSQPITETELQRELSILQIAQDQRTQIKELERKAVKLTTGSDANYEQALALINEALAICNRYPSALNNRAQIYQLMAAREAKAAAASTEADEETKKTRTDPRQSKELQLAVEDLTLAIKVARIVTKIPAPKPVSLREALQEAQSDEKLQQKREAQQRIGSEFPHMKHTLTQALLQRASIHEICKREDDAYLDYAAAAELGSEYARTAMVPLNPIAKLNADMVEELVQDHLESLAKSSQNQQGTSDENQASDPSQATSQPNSSGEEKTTGANPQ